ncbi:hypothetical protein L1987_64500 [Smallanthus sonchifolius]|uniref:Uncharacterized protein n=1 Tax=Smallanthus sonchifolius TaxID=185202 RepID=A0ACB9CGG3_9ASTR|nr:hypothetical protein L1987_64500 [Smallanthus sonchifolius]
METKLIASLKATLAKKEGDQESVQHRVSGSPGGKLSPRSPPNLQHVDSYDEPKNHRKLRADIGNIEFIQEKSSKILTLVVSARPNKNDPVSNGKGTKKKITSSDAVLERLVEWLVFS